MSDIPSGLKRALLDVPNYVRMTLLLFMVLAQIDLCAQIPIEIFDKQVSIRLVPGEQMLAFEDSLADYEIDQVRKAEHLFSTYRKGNPTGVYWLRFILNNQTEEDLRLVFAHRRMSYFDLYRFEKDTLLEHSPSGRLRHQGKLPEGNGELFAGLTIRSGVKTVVYARLQNLVDYGISPTLTVKDGVTHYEASQRRALWNFTFIGGLIVLVFFTLTQLFIYKNWTYGWLFAHTVSLALYALCLQSYYAQWFFPWNPRIGHISSYFWGPMTQAFWLLLIASFFKLKVAFPKWHVIFKWLIGFTFLRVFVSTVLAWLLMKDATITKVTQYVGLIATTTVLFFLINIWKSLNKGQKVFACVVLSYVFMALSSYAAFQLFGGARLLVFRAILIGSLLQILFYAIGLGIEMRKHEVDKNNALDQLNDVLTKQNKIIQQEVDSQTKELRDKNNRIETLFREIHHRVKNNLQLISSLLNTQREWSKEEDPAKAIEDSRSRVVAMSMIHQFLYRKDDIATIDFGEYTEELVSKLDSIQVQRVSYKLKLNFSRPFIFDIDTSISLGLILNELVTNSYKHAVAETRNLELELSLEELSEDQYLLTYRDNGQPMKTTLAEATQKGFGLRLASRLSKQLQGAFTYDYHGGNEFKVGFAGEKARMELID